MAKYYFVNEIKYVKIQDYKDQQNIMIDLILINSFNLNLKWCIGNKVVKNYGLLPK